jgi:DNA-binding response OmpR family regulator
MNNVLKGNMKASGKLRTVLCVDDNDQLRPLLTMILTKAGYAVTEATTRAEASQAVEVTQPALVILDVDLPDGNGFELARQWRQDGFSSLPILFISGDSHSERQAEAARLNARLLPKPFGPLVFLSAVESLHPGA